MHDGIIREALRGLTCWPQGKMAKLASDMQVKCKCSVDILNRM